MSWICFFFSFLPPQFYEIDFCLIYILHSVRLKSFRKAKWGLRKSGEGGKVEEKEF